MSDTVETPHSPTPPAAPASAPPRPPLPPRGGGLFLVLLLMSLVIGVVLVESSHRESQAKKATGDESAGVSLFGPSEGVGLVKVYGIIQFKDEEFSFGSSSGADGTIKQLQDLKKDTRVKALVLRVNSPGGTVAASQEIHNQVKAIAQNIPVVVSMADVAASGGYYISAPATCIYANPGTITGSIGVVTQLIKYYEILKKVGVEFPTFHKGEWKDMGSPSRPFRPGEEQLFQTLVDRAWEQFVGAVADGRVRKDTGKGEKGKVKLPERKIKSIDEVKKLATGQIYSGEEALANGLIDELGDLDMAIKKAGELAGLGASPKIIKPSIHKFEDFFSSLAANSSRIKLPFQQELGLDSPILYLFAPGR